MIKNTKFSEMNIEELKGNRGSGVIKDVYGYLFANAGDIVKKMGQRQSYYDRLYKDFK